MPRKTIIYAAIGAVLLAIGVIAGVTYFPASDDGRRSAKPNIIVFYTDDQDVGSMADMAIVQERLAAKGVTFANSFVDYSLCCPSRASFMLGQSAHNTGITGNLFAAFGEYSRVEPALGDSLPVWLHARGYKTGHFGKLTNGYFTEDIPPGWEKWFTYLSSPKAFRNTFNEDGTILAKVPGFGDDYVSRKAYDWIAAEIGKKHPVFAMIAFHVPHSPHTPAPRHAGTFADLPLPMPPNFNEADISDKPSFRQPPLLKPAQIAKLRKIHRARQEQLLVVEESVEQVIAAVRDAGEIDNTYFIFTSDNGYAQGEHRRRSGKRILYEEVIRVPLIVRGPGVPEGEARDQLVNNLDVVATIVDLAGANPGHTLDGRSLSSIISDEDADWRTHLLVHGDASDKELDLTIDPMVNRFSAVRTDRWILSRNLMADGSFVEEFYDLDNDPWQLENAIDEPAYADVIDTLRPRVETLARCAGESCWMTLPEPTASAVPPRPEPPDDTGKDET